ncbi:hypothetical protein QAD02_005500 [Eretmocerus hayati]|uniref:Uncharacterized protein n=1 Tax=Eretmocerus hayati TaxID=131215 RepID=A0ACC2NTP9_9HYME|nr:hypothetical protein QAD02_005500 [Eretmocerus hayati]
MSDNATSFTHNIYSSDPILFRDYINKKVTVTTHDANTFSGVVYTVDPVSESVILIQPAENKEKSSLKIIIGSAIKSIDCCFDSEILLPDLFAAPSVRLSEEELKTRKQAVYKLLSDNRFPVKEEEAVLLIEDTVRIEPPYRSENCMCSNSIILKRIQTLLNQVTT